ncbi:uncharacterized protein ACNLHF_005278 [Anomaloglossus baeobatrachus]|uniref:uncharacterized protein LOC142277925 n=1 Tax=Anomaloglossus baeobatrachus TaxID=238106 RepID=UPI003F4FCA1D
MSPLRDGFIFHFRLITRVPLIYICELSSTSLTSYTFPVSVQQRATEEEYEDLDSDYEPTYETETSEDEEPEEFRPARTSNNTDFHGLLQRLRQRIDEENRLDPWCFQTDPHWGENEERPLPVQDTEGRLENTNWCSCGHCKLMPRLEESICCHEFQQMDRFRHNINCIAEYADFLAKVVCRDYLFELVESDARITHAQFQRHENRILRLVAYKKFTGMVYSILGHSHRVPIPSCAVNKIRESFPDPLGRYTGFKWYATHATAPLLANFNF